MADENTRQELNMGMGNMGSMKKANMGNMKKANMGSMKKANMGNMNDDDDDGMGDDGMGNMGSMKKANMGSMKKGMMQDLRFKKKKKVQRGIEEVQTLREDLRGRSTHKNPAKYSRSLGHNIATSLVDQTTTTLTVQTNANNHDSLDFMSVVAFMAYLGGNSGTITCADSLGNTYTKVGQVSFNSGYVICLFYSAGIHTVSKNAIITVTHPGSKRRIIMGDEFKNLEKTNTDDQSVGAHNTVASTFATSGMIPTTSQDKELLYGVIGVNGPSTDTLRKPSNWTLLHDRGTNASDGTDIRLITQFRTTGTTGTYETSGTLGNARLWGSITSSFRAEGGASDVSRDT